MKQTNASFLQKYLPGLAWPDHLPSWSAFARRLSVQIDRHNVFGRAAELAFFFLFSVFPLLIVVTNLLGMLSQGARVQEDLLEYFRAVMPSSAFQILKYTLAEVTKGSSGGKLSLGIAVSLASASSGMVAVIEGLNTAYQVREARPWWKRRVLAVVLTMCLAVFCVASLSILLYGSQLGRLLADAVDWGAHFQWAWRFAKWPLMAAFVLLALALTYRFAPNLKGQKWHWIVPGAVFAFLSWLLASFGLRVYLQIVGGYSAVYGSLGAVVVLMTWLYLFSAAILIGGEVNSIIEQSAARAGDPEAKLPGEKAPGDLEKNRTENPSGLAEL